MPFVVLTVVRVSSCSPGTLPYFFSLDFTFCKAVTSARIIKSLHLPSKHEINENFYFLMGIVLTPSLGNIISTHNWSLNSSKSTEGKFVL